VRPQAPPPASADGESEGIAWVRSLRGSGRDRDEALTRLHELLLRAARFELLRRPGIRGGSGDTVDDLATQSADSALVALLAKLDGFRFESRFTTWACKFAILEAAVLARRRTWQERELPIETAAWERLQASTSDPAEELAVRERLAELADAIRSELSPHQREVLTALVLDGVPIDVLAERLSTTRGALYKTLHDARRKLRDAIGADDDV
jgi:RNA polymerase sigma-70 factor (ECF subfamily)